MISGTDGVIIEFPDGQLGNVFGVKVVEINESCYLGL